MEAQEKPAKAKKSGLMAAVTVSAVIIALVSGLAVGYALGGSGAGSRDVNNDKENITLDSLEDGMEASDSVSGAALEKVFYSPHTGSDEKGDGSQASPLMTREAALDRARELKDGVEVLEYLMSVDVYTQQGYGVSSSAGTVNMIPFTGSSQGYYFTGEIQGTGCDTQKWGISGSPAFSARYLLKGKDYTGRECSIFIENNGDALDMCTPTIITDSEALSHWQTESLRTIVTPTGSGVRVDCYRID